MESCCIQLMDILIDIRGVPSRTASNFRAVHQRLAVFNIVGRGISSFCLKPRSRARLESPERREEKWRCSRNRNKTRITIRVIRA